MASFRRKVGSSLYEAAQVESFVDDEFFAFYRDKVFVAVSNGQSPSRTITTHPYSEGTSEPSFYILYSVQMHYPRKMAQNLSY